MLKHLFSTRYSETACFTLHISALHSIAHIEQLQLNEPVYIFNKTVGTQRVMVVTDVAYNPLGYVDERYERALEAILPSPFTQACCVVKSVKRAINCYVFTVQPCHEQSLMQQA